MVYDFEYYLKNKLVKKSSKDVEEAKALSRRADERLNMCGRRKLQMRTLPLSLRMFMKQ
jgi:hypothetical protein